MVDDRTPQCDAEGDLLHIVGVRFAQQARPVVVGARVPTGGRDASIAGHRMRLEGIESGVYGDGSEVEYGLTAI